MLLLLILVILLLITLILLLLWPVKTPPGPECPPPPIPQQFDEATLASTLAVRLVGAPADGSRAAPAATPPTSPQPRISFLVCRRGPCL